MPGPNRYLHDKTQNYNANIRSCSFVFHIFSFQAQCHSERVKFIRLSKIYELFPSCSYEPHVKRERIKLLEIYGAYHKEMISQSKDTPRSHFQS